MLKREVMTSIAGTGWQEMDGTFIVQIDGKIIAEAQPTVHRACLTVQDVGFGF